MSTKPSKHYTPLSDLERFSTGYIIIGRTLFDVERGSVEDKWDLSSKSVSHMAAEARTVAGLTNRHRIVYDDEGMYDEDIVSGENELITSSTAHKRLDEEERDGWDSLAEYFM